MPFGPTRVCQPNCPSEQVPIACNWPISLRTFPIPVVFECRKCTHLDHFLCQTIPFRHHPRMKYGINLLASSIPTCWPKAGLQQPVGSWYQFQVNGCSVIASDSNSWTKKQPQALLLPKNVFLINFHSSNLQKKYPGSIPIKTKRPLIPSEGSNLCWVKTYKHMRFP